MNNDFSENDSTIFFRTEKARQSLNDAVVEGRFSQEQERFFIFTLASFNIFEREKRGVFSSLLIEAAEERNPEKFDKKIRMIRKYLSTINDFDHLVRRMDHIFDLRKAPRTHEMLQDREKIEQNL